MLSQLRLVLSTVSDRFTHEPFLRIGLMKLSPEEISEVMLEPSNKTEVAGFLQSFASYCAQDRVRSEH